MADASTKVFHGASIAYITSGASAAAAAIVGATVANALTSTNLSSYARCDLILSGVSTSNTTNAASTVIVIYRRDLDVGGVSAGDDYAPATSNSNKFVGVFNRHTTASSGAFVFTAIDIPLPGGNAGCEFWLQNNFSTNLENAGWALTVIPKTDVGATA